jgi:hypothetical protein
LLIPNTCTGRSSRTYAFTKPTLLSE